MASGKKFIQSMEIKNFKSLNTLSIEKLNYFNLFVGHNNMGKTSILEALACSFGFYPRDFFQDYLQYNRQVKKNRIEDFKAIFHNFNIAEPIEISSQIGSLGKPAQSFAYQLSYQEDVPSDKLKVSLNIQNTNNTGAKPDTAQIDWQVSIKKIDSAAKPSYRQSGIERLLIDAMQERPQEIETHYLNSNTHQQYLQVTNGHQPTIRFIVDNFQLSPDEINIIKDRQERGKLLAFIQHIDSRIDEIQFNGENTLDLYHQGMKQPFPLNEMGTGFIKIIKLYLAIVVNGIDILLCDEITDGLSPDTIAILCKEILPLLQEHNIQLWATTHSWDILNILADTYDIEQELHHYSIYAVKSNHSQNSLGNIRANYIDPRSLNASFPDFIDFREGIA